MKCPVCKGEAWKPPLDKKNTPKYGEIKYKCKGCDHTWFKMTNAEAAGFHEDNVVWRFEDFEKRDGFHNRRIEILKDVMDWPPKSALDCGCGDGRFLELVGAKRMVGIDVSSEAPGEGPYDYISGSFVTEKIDGQFDLVTSFHSLEHIGSCAGAFQKILSLSKGVVAVEVPVCRQMRWFNGGHVHGFSHRSYEMLIFKYAKEFKTLAQVKHIQGKSVLWVGRRK